MISGMDRLKAAISGVACDRIPVFCNLLDQGARELGVSLEEYYSRGALVAEGQIRMRERFAYDNVWCLFYVGRDAEFFENTQIVYAGDGPPNVSSFPIQTLDDIHRLDIPESILDHPAFAEEAKCMHLLRGECGGTYPICVYVTATMALPAVLMGMERWLELLLLGPELERDLLLEKCHNFFVKRTMAYRSGGADVVLYSNPFGSTDILPLHLFQSLSSPWIERDIRAVGPQGVVYYCGMARLGATLESVMESTGISALYLSPFDDISAACSAIGDNALACGVINDIRLIDWEPAEIRTEVARIMDAGSSCRRYLFGTGVMPYCIPEESIHTMLNAAFEYGSQRKGVAQ